MQDIAKRMGYDWGFETAEDVWNEVRRLAPKFSGMSYERLDEHGGIQWPCLDGSFEEISDNTPKEQLAASTRAQRTPVARRSLPMWCRSPMLAPNSCTPISGPRR